MRDATKEFFRDNGKTLGELALGSAIYSLGMNLFYTPAKLLAGGVTGFAQILHYQFGWSIALMVILINIPMFLVGLWLINKKFILYSAIGMGIYTLFIQLFSGLSLPFSSPLTSVVVGGVLLGLGVGLIYRSGASVGGTDIIAKILNKYFSVNMATAGLAINAVIVFASAFIFGLDQAVLTICAMFISAKVNSFVIDGIDHRRAILIITDKKEELSKALMERLNRGVTIIDAQGAYTGQEHWLMYIVINKHQLGVLKSVIKRVDPKAFFTIITVNGVYGHGSSFFSMKQIDS
ncbi:MAG: YitT family protein [Firmicutes bacterium]|nr:YitT family protein [Bacillota bacterium]